jgi:SAM-dependent methyltransferase
MGRHARALSKLGYSVIGIDRDPEIIAKAQELDGGPEYVIADMRDYAPEPGAYDAVVVMSQSFGYFDAATNRDVLNRLANSVHERGRIILDLWNPEFFATHQGERELETPRGAVRENKRLEGDRLFVQLDYPDRAQETFEWQLFTPPRMKKLAESVGSELLLSCTDFNEKTVPSAANPRIQFVLARCAW